MDAGGEGAHVPVVVQGRLPALHGDKLALAAAAVDRPRPALAAAISRRSLRVLVESGVPEHLATLVVRFHDGTEAVLALLAAFLTASAFG